MKTLIKCLIFSTALIGFSLNSKAQDLIETFKNHPNVETIVVNKKMFEMMSNVKTNTNDKENQAYLNLIKKLDDLKLVSTKNSSASTKMKTFVGTYVKTNSLSELMSLSDTNSNSIFYANANATNDNIKELLMYITGNETVILILKGSFSLNELVLVTNKMNLPIGNSIKKASK